MTQIGSSDPDVLDSLKRLTQSHLVPIAAEWLIPQVAILQRDIQSKVVDDVPAYSASGNPDVIPSLEKHVAACTHDLIRILGGAAPGDFAFVTEHARACAGQRFPLEAILHTYRCYQRVLIRWLGEAIIQREPLGSQPSLVIDVTDFALAYTNLASSIASAAYVDAMRNRINVEGDRRARLLKILLDGYDESDGRVSRQLRNAGYLDNRQAFCVVLAQPVDPSEMLISARASRLADSLEQSLALTNTRATIGVREDYVVAVVSHARRLSGWTAPQSSLAARIISELAKIGPAALIGISNDAPSTSHVPAAFREAGLALEMADVRNRVVQISDVPIQRLMLQLCGADILSALPAWSEGFIRADKRSRGKLAATLRAYADSNMNILKAADALDVHPNTVYARMQKIEDVTGLDARSYRSLNDLLQVSNCYDAFAA